MASNSTRARVGARALAAAAAVTFAATALATTAAQAAAPVPVAGAITDDQGDFLTTYIGPRNADLDVKSANVTYDGQFIYFTAEMYGDIGTTQDGLYVWGVDRGNATDILFHPPAPGPGEIPQPPVGENVNFNAFIAIVPTFANGVPTYAGSKVVLTDNGRTTNIGAAEISISGAKLNLRLERSLFPSTGADISQMGFNLWPRITGIGRTDFVSDFAPGDRNFLASPTPEPATWAMMIGGFGLVGGAMRRRRVAAVPA